MKLTALSTSSSFLVTVVVVLFGIISAVIAASADTTTAAVAVAADNSIPSSSSSFFDSLLLMADTDTDTDTDDAVPYSSFFDTLYMLSSAASSLDDNTTHLDDEKYNDAYEDSIILNDDNVYIRVTDSFVELGRSSPETTGSDGTGNSFQLKESVRSYIFDNTITIDVMDEDGNAGSLAFYEDRVVIGSLTGNRDDLILLNPTYKYTTAMMSDVGGVDSESKSDSDLHSDSIDEDSGESDDSYNNTEDSNHREEGYFMVQGSTETCATFFLAFNAEGDIFTKTTQDCDFTFAYVESFRAVRLGTKDAFVVFMKKSVLFGSSPGVSNDIDSSDIDSSGSRFTWNATIIEQATKNANDTRTASFSMEVADTEETKDGIVMTTTTGSTMMFTYQDTVVYTSSDPKAAAVLTITSPIYSYYYLNDAFIISGTVDNNCENKFYLSFSKKGVLSGSNNCGFFPGVVVSSGSGNGIIGSVGRVGNVGNIGSGNRGSDASFGSIGSADGSSDEDVVVDIDVDSISADDDDDTDNTNHTGVDGDDDLNGELDEKADSDSEKDAKSDSDEVADADADADSNKGSADADDSESEEEVDSESEEEADSDSESEEGANSESEEETDADADADGSCKSIPDLLLCGDESITDFSIFCALWTGINPSFKGDSITVFVPTDEAFNHFYDLFDEADVTIDDEILEEIFLFHSTPGTVLSTDFECGGLLKMMENGSSRTKCETTKGERDYFTVQGSGNSKNNIIPVIGIPDLETICGEKSIVHVISEVLLPNFVEELQ